LGDRERPDAARAIDRIARRLPVFRSFRRYRPGWLAGDLIAGLMLAAVALPEQLATAKLAGFPVEYGLIAFAAGTLAIATFGTNRFISVGADSTIAPIFAGSLTALARANGVAYHELAALLAACVGAILIGVGIARAGWVADLLSVPVITGILAGIAVHIIVGQLPSFLGITNPDGALLQRLVVMLRDAGRANPYSCALGSAVLAVTLLAAWRSERIPGALIGLILAACAVATFDLGHRGVALLGELHAVLPRLGLPGLRDANQLAALAPLALVVAAVCVLQTSLVVRSFPSASGAVDDPARDFMAIGVGNVLAGCCGAFPVDSSPPRTSVVAGAGGRSQLSGLIALATIAVFFARWMAYVPQAALAGVLIFIGLRLIRIGDMVKIARQSRYEINLAIAGALLVIVLPIQTGMLLAIMLSLAHGITLVMWPPSTQLFLVRGSTVWWPPSGERDVVDVPGVVVFAPAAPINFTNADYIRSVLMRLVERAGEPVKLVVIEASGMTDVDYTGAQMLSTTIEALRGRRIDVALARLSDEQAQRAVARSGLLAQLGANRVFLSVQEAVAAVARVPERDKPRTP
jgi:SulP family sulfate permease